MKLAFIGTHGIPANYGGAETSVEELSTRLVKKGHEVTVYGRSFKKFVVKDNYKGVKSVKIRSFKNKELDFVYRRVVSSLLASFKKFDVLHYYGNDGGLYALLPKIFRKKIVVTCDGFEWERDSYSFITKKVLKMSLNITAFLANKIIMDNVIVKDWFENTFNISTEYMPYGAHIESKFDDEVLINYGLIKKEYFVFVGRLVQEKRIEILINAYNKVDSEKKLVIIGDNIYDPKYVDYLKSVANKDKILFLGAVYGRECGELTKGAYGYISASSLEGSSPSLIQAMGYGLPVIVSDIQPNLEVIGNTGSYFESENVYDLVSKINMMLLDENKAKKIGLACQERCKKNYSWEKIVSDHEKIYQSLIKKEG